MKFVVGLAIGFIIAIIILLAMLQNGLNLLGVSSYFFQVVIGLAILLSTGITGMSSRAGRRRRSVAATEAAIG